MNHLSMKMPSMLLNRCLDLVRNSHEAFQYFILCLGLQMDGHISCQLLYLETKASIIRFC